MDSENKLWVTSYQVKIDTDLYESLRVYHFKADIWVDLLLLWQSVTIQSLVGQLLNNIIQLVLLFVVLNIFILNFILHLYIILERRSLNFILSLICLYLEVEGRKRKRLPPQRFFAFFVYHIWLLCKLSFMVIRIYIPLSD